MYHPQTSATLHIISLNFLWLVSVLNNMWVTFRSPFDQVLSLPYCCSTLPDLLNHCIKFETVPFKIMTAVLLKIHTFTNTGLCQLVNSHQYFKGSECLPHPGHTVQEESFSHCLILKMKVL